MQAVLRKSAIGNDQCVQRLGQNLLTNSGIFFRRIHILFDGRQRQVVIEPIEHRVQRKCVHDLFNGMAVDFSGDADFDA